MSDQKPQILPSKPKVEFGKTYFFRLRQHKGGEFNNGQGFGNLWELAIMTPQGRVEKMISDADALNYCLENLQGELENDGF